MFDLVDLPQRRSCLFEIYFYKKGCLKWVFFLLLAFQHHGERRSSA